MKILLDMNLSPAWVSFLEHEGYEVKHWSSVGAITAPDTEIMEWARRNEYIVFTHDLDYGTLLFVTKAVAPSVLQLRCEDIRPTSVGTIVVRALEKAQKEIEQGVLVTVDLRKSRIRLLPLKRNNC